jgi:long-chain-fatty-acid---luciferin-component ligase
VKRSSVEATYIEHVIFEQVHWRDVDAGRVALEASEAHAAMSERCELYRRLDGSGVRLPSGEALVPSYLFKSHPVHFDGLDVSGLKACTSSGTLGTKSVVHRDDRTLERFVGSVGYGIGHLLGRDHDRRRAFVLSPPPADAGDLWFSYVLSLVDVFYQTGFYGAGGKIDFSRLWTDLQSESFYQPLVVGPPSLIVDFMAFLKRSGLTLDLGGKDAFIVTAGGWKNRASEQISPPAFRAQCACAFGLSPERVRDSFNMVELNSVMFECEHHRMHVPPWLRVEVLDPITMREVEGEGILAFLDPTAGSYPGHVLSEDVGRIERGLCPCGIDGPRLTFLRRVKANEQRGCATKMSLFDAT